MTQNQLWTAFAVSSVCHALLLGAQALWVRGLPAASTPSAPHVLDIVYERPREPAQHAAQFQRAVRGGEPLAVPGLLGAAPRVRIGSQSESLGAAALPGPDAARQAVVDLTNIVEAAQGDPVLLSYFGAIRERIQRTANQRPWLEGELAQGMVYVTFALNAAGRVESVAVVQERSTRSPGLQAAAANIIKAASPFPPFPPSMGDSRKTIVVPLEFLLHS